MATNKLGQKRHFAESDPRVRVELKKADMLLQKEIQRLEKQTLANTGYISDHQQAMKMSWRRLEMQRKREESPTTSRRTQRSSGLDTDKRKRLLFANTTALFMDVPSSRSDPEITSHHTTSAAAHRDSNDPLSSSDSTPFLTSAQDELPTMKAHVKGRRFTSPYISSPVGFRRQAPAPTKNSSHPLAKSVLTSSTTNSTNESTTAIGDDEATTTESSSAATGGQDTVTVAANSKTVSKQALLKAKQMMNIDSKSYDPSSFQQFYSTTDVQSAGSSRILLSDLETSSDEKEMTEEEMMKQLTLEEQESLKKVKQEKSELTLAEMFEQIKKCRYIRHYHPHGSVEGEEEENETASSSWPDIATKKLSFATNSKS